MKLAKKLATISTATTALFLSGAGSSQAQGEGGLFPLLGSPSIVLVCLPAGQVGHDNSFNGIQNISCSQSGSATTTAPSGGRGEGVTVTVIDNTNGSHTGNGSGNGNGNTGNDNGSNDGNSAGPATTG
ncbi:hypothetical protein ACGFZB_38215 [Streptomyces cinerochromogenes]|uniref:Uncharacterized protein n=1 Tax=Streptomyces cinerochromogenes TaxID=66422 RepID=A0ABW7BG72_9ACTN